MSVKQDLSGHITLTVRNSAFINEVNKKFRRIDVARQHNIDPPKLGRNPIINTERSPRNMHKGFDSSIPAAPPQKPRWEEVDKDWGLMSKLASQKPIYDAIRNKEKFYKEELALTMKSREENEAKIDAELKKQRDKFNSEKRQMELFRKRVKGETVDEDNSIGSKTMSTRSKKSSVGHYPDELDSLMEEEKRAEEEEIKSRTSKPKPKKKSVPHYLTTFHDPFASENSSQAPEKISPKKFTQLHISQFRKTVGETHPDTLAKFRAERAKKFVNSQDALTVPKPKLERPIGSFRPAGAVPKFIPTLEPYKKKEKPRASSAKSNQELTLDSDTLLALSEELKRTEDEIERQKLKIGLKQKHSRLLDKRSKTAGIL